MRRAVLGLLVASTGYLTWTRVAREPDTSSAVLGSDGDAKNRSDDGAPVVLRAPQPELQLAGPPAEPVELVSKPGYRWFARTVLRDVPIFHSTRRGQFELGGLRLGSAVRVRPASGQVPCSGGWFQVEPRGYICVAHGLRVGREVPPVEGVLRPPNPNAALPFRYVHVKDRSAYLYDRPPRPEEREAVRSADEDTMLELRARSMDGGFFLAVEDEVQAHGKRWLRTLHDNYVTAEATREIEPSKLQGSQLGPKRGLPLAFVVRERAPVFERTDDGLERQGVAERYARLPLERAPQEGRYVHGKKGRLLLRDHVRVARTLPRPEEVPEGARWVHVNLSSQTLVAYEGDAPRFATLVATGLPERATPTGVYQIHYKYLSTTMRGEDESGPFEVQEVPWTMYYERNYALHGAYWHDAFGAPRSHGCTNLAPLDARWLFHFVEPELPAGWHRSADIGTHVVVTGSTEDA